MTADEIKELIQIVNDSGIAELEVQRGDDRVRIRRANPQAAQDYVLPPSPMVMAQGATSSAPALSSAPSTPSTAPTHIPAPAGPASDDEAGRVYVKSPIVGTFYEASSPDAAPFVKVGDRVAPGQVLCIIESMKLMNEIECEVSGIIAAKLVDNGRPLEYGEALFAVQTS